MSSGKQRRASGRRAPATPPCPESDENRTSITTGENMISIPNPDPDLVIGFMRGAILR
jgi:hypothetical protein